MSGISGAWRFAHDACNVYQEEERARLASILAHRGNTAAAVYQNEDLLLISNYFAVAQNDSTTAIFHDDTTGIVIGFAGRIYNLESLRNEVKAKGHPCTSQTQEEAVLRAFLAFGTDFALHLDGMFGGILFDTHSHKMWLFRDRTGQRDLFYTIQPEGVYFGSELKAVLSFLRQRPALNHSAISAGLMHSMIYEPQTPYVGIYKLEKATVRQINAQGENSAHLYWDVFAAYRSGLEFQETNFETAKQNLRTVIFEAVESMLLPGEEIGSFLSGGYDSTLLAGVLAKLSPRKVHTFSLGFQRTAYDESEYAAAAARHLGVQHHMLKISYRDVEADWDAIWNNYDEPFANTSAFAEFACARLAKSYVRCALGGEGGDELFLGYELNQKLLCTGYSFPIPTYSKKYKSMQPQYNQFLPELFQSMGTIQIKKLLVNPQFENHLQALYTKWLYDMPGCLPNRSGMCFFTGNHMSELMKVDRACQLAGIETRRPLHTPRVIDCALRMPLALKDRRYIYKQAFLDMFPDKIYFRTKKGFSIPIVEWLHTYRRDEVSRLFDRDLIEAQGIFKYDALAPYLQSFHNGNANDKFRYLYGFQKWYCDVYAKL